MPQEIYNHFNPIRRATYDIDSGELEPCEGEDSRHINYESTPLGDGVSGIGGEFDRVEYRNCLINELEERERRRIQSCRDRGVNNGITNSKQCDMKKEIFKFKVGDILIQEKEGDSGNHYWLSNRKGKVFTVVRFDIILEDKGNQFKVYIDKNDEAYLESTLRIATSKEIQNWEKRDKLIKSVRKSNDRMEMIDIYKKEGRDINELDQLKLNHPDGEERRRKHHPPTDEEGLSEQDLTVE